MSLPVSCRLFSSLTALPLILALAPMAQAATLNVTGVNGANGAPGLAGGNGSSESFTLLGSGASNGLTVRGGSGGNGGDGLTPGQGGGAGGNGGSATAVLQVSGADASGASVAYGGHGGNTGQTLDYTAPGAAAGQGGDAAASTLLTGHGSLTGSSFAQGGWGGGDAASGQGGTPAQAGTATAQTRATLDGDASLVDLTATAQGGDGAGSYSPFGQNAPGTDGADVTLTDAVGLTAQGHRVEQVALKQYAYGGAAGGLGPDGGRGGAASSSLTATDQATGSSTMFVQAVGGNGPRPAGYSSAGMVGGDATARGNLTTTAQEAELQVSATGGSGSFNYGFFQTPQFGATGGNARADAHLTLTTQGATGEAYAFAQGGNYGTPGADQRADAHARLDGGTGQARAASSFTDILGGASASASGAREATSHSGLTTGAVTPGAYGIQADHVQVSAERGLAYNGNQDFGYGMFSAGYGGTGDAQTYSANSQLTFYSFGSGYNPPPAGPSVYLDLLSFKSIGDGFDSLTLNISWGGLWNDGSGGGYSMTQTFVDLMGFQAFFDSDPFLVDRLYDFQISYSYTAHTAGSGFAFDYRLAQSPTTPLPSAVPLPAGLALLASALAGLGLMRRRRG